VRKGTVKLGSLIAPFEEAINKREERLARHAEKQRIIGWFCTYTPIEMIHAAGFLPVRIRGGETSIERTNDLVPSFICPYMRASLERGLRGEYRYLSGIVQGYSCDVTCGVVDIWKENIGNGLYHTIPLPYNNNPGARKYFRESLNELSGKLTGIGGKFSQTILAKSLNLYGDIRATLIKLHELRLEGRLPFSARQFYTVAEAGFSLPPVDYLAHLSILLAELPNVTEDGAEESSLRGNGVQVLVSGSLIENMNIYDLLEEAGLHIIADDLCSGYRFCDPVDGEGADRLERLIDRYMNRFPCPSRSYFQDRVPRLIQRVKDSGARGIILILQKFCTPHLADYPALTVELKNAGIPSLLVELEESGGAPGQLKTRFEAFREMIHG